MTILSTLSGYLSNFLFHTVATVWLSSVIVYIYVYKHKLELIYFKKCIETYFYNSLDVFGNKCNHINS